MSPDNDAVRRLAETISPRGEIVLTERRTDGRRTLELRVNGVYVMDTTETSSEIALARAALTASAAPTRVLVGGLGLGFTAAEVLADDRVEELVVVEIEGALIDWMRDGTIDHGPALVADPRLRIVHADLRDVLSGDDRFDLVLLDIDNGPDNLVHDSNAALYDESGLAAAREAVKEGGTLAIWSASRSENLQASLTKVVGPTSEVVCPVHAETHPTDYYLYVATRATPDERPSR